MVRWRALHRDDVMFWWNDLVNHTEPSYPDSVPDFGQDANGKLCQV